MKQLRLTFFSVLLAMASLLSAGTSWAVSGTVTGRAWLFINQGQSCSTAAPYNMNCAAARFPVSANNSNQPIRQARVEVADQAGAIIGVSSTDQNGNFSISWTRATTPTSATVRWVYSHVDNRFRVAPPTNPASVWFSSTWSFSVVAGGTTAIGDAFWGDTEERQAYDSSFKMWNEALSYSGVAGSVWSGIAILANDSSLSPGRGTIDSANKYVKLGPGSARYPISDVHHESGHLVHYLANTSLKWAVMYNYPTSCTSGGCSGDGHSLDTPEWKASGFPEGLASFIGTVASYWYWANQPQFCINSLTPCGSTGWNQEVRPAGACVTDEDRFELSAQRYLWDVYDSVDDAAYADTIGADTSTSFSYGALIDELATFGAGTGNGQINEPWNAALTSIDAHDGRSAADLQAKINESTTTQRSNNCNP